MPARSSAPPTTQGPRRFAFAGIAALCFCSDAAAVAGGRAALAPVLFALLLLAFALLLFWLMWRRHRREQRLYTDFHRRQERYKSALRGSGSEFWDWDIRGNLIHRIGADHLLDFDSEHSQTGEDWHDNAIHPDDLPREQQLMREHLEGRSAMFESEHRIRTRHGEWIWVRARGKVVERDAAGRPLRVAGTARDITASRRDERERRIAGEVLRNMSEAVAVVDLDFRFVSVNPAFSRVTGYSEQEVIGQSVQLLDSTQHVPEFYRRMRERLEQRGRWTGEMWQRRKDGKEFLCSLAIRQVRDEAGARTHFVAVLNDITDNKRAEQELRYLAHYDALTGLPNRASLSARLARVIVRARRHGQVVAVLLLNLDRFKEINDSLGHAAGDRILKAAATRMLGTVGAPGFVARLDGDEFTVVLEDARDLDTVECTVRKLIAAFLEPLEIGDGYDVTISLSIGISLYPGNGLEPTDLLKSADTAMRQAKAAGRNAFQFYTESLDIQARRLAAIAGALRKALDRGEMRLEYQPRLSLADGRISGVEALLRWQNVEFGNVPPSVFVPLAEESGLIVRLGEWVLREACLTLQRWREHGLNDLAMAVNVSVLQLLRGNMPELLQRVLTESGIPPERLELELTESMVMANAKQTLVTIEALRRCGVRLAIDDFGTGYSSLIYLKRLPIDTLKIDKAFIDDLTRDPDDEAITVTIITMAHSLGLNVIAEGVETEQQFAYLLERGCDEIQGYWLSRPLDPDRCLAFLRSWEPATVSLIPHPSP